MTSIERFNRAEARTFRLYRLLRATVALALTGLLCRGYFGVRRGTDHRASPLGG